MTIGLLRDSTFLGQCNTRCNINLHDKCRSGHRMDKLMDTESRLSTEGKFYPGLNYRSEETCDPSSRPCKQNAATWKPLTVTGGDDKSERSTCGPRLGKPRRKAKP